MDNMPSSIPSGINHLLPPILDIPPTVENLSRHAWYFSPHSGGYLINFTEYKGTPLNKLSYYYLDCLREMERSSAPDMRLFCDAFEDYRSGLMAYAENDHGKFVATFGLQMGRSLAQCSDSDNHWRSSSRILNKKPWYPLRKAVLFHIGQEYRWDARLEDATRVYPPAYV